MRSEQLQLTQLKGRYSLFSEKISLVINAGEEIPIIFNFKENSLELYFPFDIKNINGRFIGDLKKEIETYFENGIVEPLDNEFVAYEVYSEHGFRDSIEHMTKDIPVTLITAGFNKIVPYRLE